jgi:WD40 repeat protein
MKRKHSWMQILIYLSVLVTFPINSSRVQASTAPADLQVISPQNVMNLQFLRSIGQGIFSGTLDVQPEGKIIAAATSSGIALLDRESGKQTGFIPIGFQVSALSISPDSQTLAVVYNVPTGKLSENNIFNGPEYQRRISFYSLPDGQIKGNAINDLQECAHSNIWQIAFLPDGNQLVFEKKYGDQRGDTKKFCVISMMTGKITGSMDIPEKAYSTISPDGNFAAVVPHDQENKADNVIIYDTGTFHPVVSIKLPQVTWPEISFTRQGSFVMRYSEGKSESSPHQVCFWSIPEGNFMFRLQEQERYILPVYPGNEQTEPYDRIMSEDVSPDGRWVVTGSQNGKVKLWNTRTGLMEKELGVLTWTNHNLIENPAGAGSGEKNSYVNPVMFSSDGMMVVAAENLTTYGQSGQIHIYQMPDGKEKSVFTGETVGDESIGLAFSPDNREIVFGGFADGRVEVHSVSDGKLVLTLSGHTALVNQTRYSPDGNWIATASDDHTIRLWNAKNGEMVRILNGHTARVNQIIFSPDSQWLISGADDNSIRRWQIDNGSLVEMRSLGDENWRIQLMTFLADQHTVLYTAAKYPSPLTGYTIRQVVWDVESGKETPVGGGKITIMSMAKDGQTFVGSSEKGVTVGTLDSKGKIFLFGSSIRSPFGNGALAGGTLSPDNQLLISGNGFGLQAWELKGTSVSFLSRIAGGEPVPEYSYFYEISPDGKVLAFASGGVVYLMGVPVQ